MEIATNGISINVISESNSVSADKTPILFLHGFTGSCGDWSFLFSSLNSKCFPMAIDLPGHGKTRVPNNAENFTTDAYSDIIKFILDYFNISKVILIGYSMGGRVALSFAAKNNERVLGLILESSTAGIEDKRERAIRIKTDNKLVDKLLKEGIDPFVNYWMDLPFFSSLKSLADEEYAKIVLEKRQNSTNGLANSLLGFSAGKMPSLWSDLNSLSIPTLLIAGSLDQKYVRINREMNQLIPNSKLEIVKGCGHNTHLENREEFIILVNKFLNNLESYET
ncbi:MAG: 2-succinyl-6-hydroxy-2,4-cyclohexadiene-1-carboxylate synthase [Melioribacteraceae bacterium]|nr:2-succinyl-6-hydroxy-2,4-cyclohexadiene-1-carboxylate synthase [Melioribacteraceae bacterium]